MSTRRTYTCRACGEIARTCEATFECCDGTWCAMCYELHRDTEHPEKAFREHTAQHHDVAPSCWRFVVYGCMACFLVGVTGVFVLFVTQLSWMDDEIGKIDTIIEEQNLRVRAVSEWLSAQMKEFSSPAVCHHYASPWGFRRACSVDKPCAVAQLWDVLNPGDTACLQDGLYTGPHSMLAPPPHVSGTATHPITIRALNAGKAVFNGEGERYPVEIGPTNAHVILQDITATEGIAFPSPDRPILTGADGTIYVSYVNNMLKHVIARKDPKTGVWTTIRTY